MVDESEKEKWRGEMREMGRDEKGDGEGTKNETGRAMGSGARGKAAP